ncbi:MAG: DUF2313 domain-containing protein [Gammaproteobacteria bacterium]|nr:DUF2313 domain-containing protein [Gammaproteobacteria bacterium]
MSFNIAEYLQQLKQLLPVGALWDSLQADVTIEGYLEAEADEFARIDARASNLINETDPRTAFELLPEWEAFAGLPGGCIGEIGTLEQRQQALHAKLTALGGQSIPYYIEFAAAIGYDTTVTEFPVFNVEDSVDAEMNDESWRYTWRLNAPDETINYWSVEGGVDEGFATWGNERLECAINEIKPAHTYLIFAYGG